MFAVGQGGENLAGDDNRRARRVKKKNKQPRKKISGIARRSRGSEPACLDGEREKDFRISQGKIWYRGRGKRYQPLMSNEGFLGIAELLWGVSDRGGGYMQYYYLGRYME